MISVIIVNYRTAHLIERAVKSLFVDSGDVEVIVVDNSCSGEEGSRLREISQSYPLTLIFNSENVGFARANNQAFARSKGEYVLLLNPDAFLLPDCLVKLRRFLEDMPDAGAASPMVNWDDAGRFYFPYYPFPSPFTDLCIKVLSTSKKLSLLYSLCERRNNLRLWKSSECVQVNNLHGGVLMVKRSAVEMAGGLFDERFFLFFEDTDLCFRLGKRGYHLYILPSARAVHNYCHSARKLDLMSETLHIYNEKHYSGNFFLKLSSKITETALPAKTDYGTWNNPFSIAIPDSLEDGYLFEWSPNWLFRPAIGFFGTGPIFTMPDQVWGFLDPGVYYSRISDPNRTLIDTEILCWRKDG